MCKWKIREIWELDNSKRSKLQKNRKIGKKIMQVSKIWKLENAKSCRIRESWELATGSCQGRSIPCNAPRTNTRISTTKEEYRLQMKKWRNFEEKIRNSQIQNNSSKWGDPDCFPLVSRRKLGGEDQLDKSETFSCGEMQTTRIYADMIMKLAYSIEYHL